MTTIRNIVLTSIALLFCTALAAAQTAPATAVSPPEMGDISEIKDAETYYVYSEDLKAREMILKELAKCDWLRPEASIEKADFVVAFGGGAAVVGYSGSSTWGRGHGSSNVWTNSVQAGQFYVYRPRTSERTSRIYFAVQKERYFSGAITLSRHPAKNAMRDFVKALKSARGEQ